MRQDLFFIDALDTPKQSPEFQRLSGPDQAGFEARFPDTTAAFAAAVDIPGITPPRRLHPLRESVRRIRREQPVHGVGHPLVSVHRTAVWCRAGLQPVQAEAVIRFGKKAGRAPVAALHDVLRMIGQVDA